MPARDDGRRLDELRRGLQATAPYLLSHHVEDDLDRCHHIVIGGREIHLCARCSGIWPGIAVAAGAVLIGVVPAAAPTTLLAVAVLPLFALVDWARSAGHGDRGSNPVRTATGFLLGAGVGLGYAALVAGGVTGAVGGVVTGAVGGTDAGLETAVAVATAVVGIGVAYAVAAAVLLRRTGVAGD